MKPLKTVIIDDEADAVVEDVATRGARLAVDPASNRVGREARVDLVRDEGEGEAVPRRGVVIDVDGP